MDTVWNKNQFPTRDTVKINGWCKHGDEWFAAKYKTNKPFCWTPTEPFRFGGKRFVALYPCIAFATKNFGWIAQNFCGETNFGQE